MPRSKSADSVGSGESASSSKSRGSRGTGGGERLTDKFLALREEQELQRQREQQESETSESSVVEWDKESELAEVPRVEITSLDEAFEAVRNDPYALADCSEPLNSNLELVIAAVRQNTDTFRFAAEALRGDHDVVCQVLRFAKHGQPTAILRCVPRRLLDDRSFVETAVAKRGQALEFAPPELQDGRSREVTSRVVTGGLPRPELQDDFNIAKVAVAEDGEALRFASARLKRDRKLVLAGVHHQCGGGSGLRHAAAELRSDRKFMMTAVKLNGQVLRYASKALRADEEVVSRALGNYAVALGCASGRLRDREELVSKAVNRQGRALMFASPEVRESRDVVMDAMFKTKHALRYADPSFREDPSVLALL